MHESQSSQNHIGRSRRLHLNSFLPGVFPTEFISQRTAPRRLHREFNRTSPSQITATLHPFEVPGNSTSAERFPRHLYPGVRASPSSSSPPILPQDNAFISTGPSSVLIRVFSASPNLRISNKVPGIFKYHEAGVFIFSNCIFNRSSTPSPFNPNPSVFKIESERADPSSEAKIKTRIGRFMASSSRTQIRRNPCPPT